MPKDVETSEVKVHSDAATNAPQKRQWPRRSQSFFEKHQTLLSVIAIIAITGGGIWWFTRPKESAADKKKDRSVPVTVARAGVESVPIEIRTIGNVLAYSTVNVVPQVGGQLKKVCFTQGQLVKQGDLLFQIDPRPYQAALDQARGNVAKDAALVKAAEATVQKDIANVEQLQANLSRDVASAGYAKVEMKRYVDLVNQGAVSHEQSDQMTTNAATSEATILADKKAIENARAIVASDRAQVDTAKGTLEADEAVLQNAQIQLGWTQIRSPLDGRTSSLNVYQGNVVAANNSTPLVSIAQVQPIYIQFTVPEANLDHIRRCLSAGTLRVEALVEGVKKNAVEGAVSFLENTVNTTSGTIVLRATFTNQENRLYPGQFVDVIVTMPPDSSSVVVPAAAVSPSQQGNSVYVVDSNLKVRLVPVELARTHGDTAAISKGLNAGDMVVTDGQLQLMPGATVRIVDENGKPLSKQ